MILLQEAAYGKLNLTLDVLQKREDGYHDLESIMQAVSLRDDIELKLETREPWTLSCDREGIPCTPKNLAWKAAKVFYDSGSFPDEGLSIHIRKRIPTEAGMGGGSADAAAVLRALNRAYGEPYSVEELAALGTEVGSDVPFCVVNGTAFARGRGEKLESLACNAKLHYVICKPDLSFSTPTLFSKLDETPISRRPNHLAVIQALEKGEEQLVAEGLYNVFEEAVRSDYPEILHLKERLLQEGAWGAQMTGSGSVVFGIFPTRQQAQQACESIKAQWTASFVCENI